MKTLSRRYYDVSRKGKKLICAPNERRILTTLKKFRISSIIALYGETWSVNVLQDFAGDTPLHDAIDQGRADMIEVLMAVKGKNGVADATISNEKGFRPLHSAAIRGNASATRMILSKVNRVQDAKLYGSYYKNRVGSSFYLTNQSHIQCKRSSTAEKAFILSFSPF